MHGSFVVVLYFFSSLFISFSSDAFYVFNSKHATLTLFPFNNATVALTWNLEDLMPPSEKLIFNFNSKEELKNWHLYSDSEYGGLYIFNLSVSFA